MPPTHQKLIPTVHARSVLALLCYHGLLNARTQRWLPFLGLEDEMFYLRKLVHHGQVAIDVGANVGIYTGWLSRLVGPLGRVIALEPYPPTFKRLTRNLLRMRAKNVTALNVAAGEVMGRTTLELPLRRGIEVIDPYVHISPISVPGGETEMAPIDELAHRAGLSSVNLIKVDVEGFEASVIRGARSTIRRFQPSILIEIFDRWAQRYGSGFHEVNEELVELGTPASYSRGKIWFRPRTLRQ